MAKKTTRPKRTTRQRGRQKGRLNVPAVATHTRHSYSAYTPGQRFTEITEAVGLTPRPGGTFGLDVTINSPNPGDSMQAANWRASGGCQGASSITVTLCPVGGTITVQGGEMSGPPPSTSTTWVWQFQSGAQAGNYNLTAEVYDNLGNSVSETITVRVP